MSMFPDHLTGLNPNLTAFASKIQVFKIQIRMGQKGDPMKMNFDNFQMQNRFAKQLGLKKQMK